MAFSLAYFIMEHGFRYQLIYWKLIICCYLFTVSILESSLDYLLGFYCSTIACDIAYIALCSNVSKKKLSNLFLRSFLSIDHRDVDPQLIILSSDGSLILLIIIRVVIAWILDFC